MGGSEYVYPSYQEIIRNYGGALHLCIYHNNCMELIVNSSLELGVLFSDKAVGFVIIM